VTIESPRGDSGEGAATPPETSALTAAQPGASTSTATAQPFAGIRVTHRSPKPLDAVVATLRAIMGVLSTDETTEMGRRAKSAAEFEAIVTPRLGDSGFVLMQEIDHGPWLKNYGIQGPCLRWIFGNPLIAITMIRPDPVAGLFVPLELLLAESPQGGSVITYVLPSSQMVVDGNAALRAAATALDGKVAALIGLAFA
jgi:uncharacterized protein (DUF302 family)